MAAPKMRDVRITIPEGKRIKVYGEARSNGDVISIEARDARTLCAAKRAVPAGPGAATAASPMAETTKPAKPAKADK